MIRRLIFLLLAVVVPVGVILLAGRRFVSRDGQAKRRLQEALTIQLAQSLGAAVRVGELDGNLASGFEVQDVAIANGPTFERGVFASAEAIHVRCNVWAAVRRGTSPIEAVEEVRVVGLRGSLIRTPDGKLNIDRLLPKRKGPAAAPGPRFKGRIVVENADLVYTDYAREPPALTGLNVHLTHVSGTADFARRGVVRFTMAGNGEGAPVGQVEASGSYVSEDRAWSANASVTGVDLAALSQRLVRHPAVQVRSGTADAVANVCLVPGELVDYAVSGHARQVTAQVPALGGESVTAEADFSATPAGLVLTGLRGTALGADVSIEGTVFDLKRPTLDLTASAENVDVERWGEVAPKLADALPKVSGAEAVQLQGRVTGPITNPDVTFTANCPSSLELRYARKPQAAAADDKPPAPAVTGRASGVAVSVSAPDLQTGDVVVRASADEVSVGDLAPLLPEQDYLTAINPSPVHHLDAEVLYSQHTAATAGHVTIDAVETDRGTVRGISVDYAVVGRAVRANVSAASVLSGRLKASGLVDFSGEEPEAYAQFEADDLDVGELVNAAAQERLEAEGRASASGALVVHGGKLEVAAEATGHKVRLHGVEADDLHAYVGVTNDALDVRYLTAAGPMGVLWARGTVPFDGPMDLEAAAANVPLPQVQAVVEGPAAEEDTVEGPRVAGTAFAHGRVRGDVGDPHLSADVAVFGGGLGKVASEAVTAQIDASPEEVRLSNLLARWGTGVVSGEVVLSDLTWPPGSLFADEEAGSEEASQIDGSLQGSLRLAGLDLSQIGESVELPPDVYLMGLGAAEVDLAGTLSEPHARGSVSATRVKVLDERDEIGIGPIEFTGSVEADRDKVRLTKASASSDAGSLTAWGTLSGWGTEEGPSVREAGFEAHDLSIASYLPAEGPLALLSGTVDEVTGTVAGPLSDPWPTVSAEVSADEVRFGRRVAHNVGGTLEYREGELSAGEVSGEVAGGTVEVTDARYRLSDGRLNADLGAGRLNAQELVFLAADIAAQERDDGEAVRDRVYGYGHRVRGWVSAEELQVEGTLDDLSGRVVGLSTGRTEFDRRSIPGFTAGLKFTGLALVPPEMEASDEEPEPDVPAAIARLRVDDLRLESEPIGEGVVRVHGQDISQGAALHWDDGRMDLVVDVDMVPVSAISEWLPPGLDVGGELTLTVNLEAKEASESPEVRGSLTVVGPTVAGVRFDLLEAAYVEVQPHAIVMTGGLLKRGLNEVQAHGSLPFDREHLRFDLDGDVSFEARIDELPAEVLVQLADELARHAPGAERAGSLWGRCRTDGLLTAWLNVTGRLREPQVNGGVSVEQGATFRLADWAEGSSVHDIKADVTFASSTTGVGAQVNAVEVTGAYENTTFDLAGEVDVSYLDPDRLLQNHVQGLTLAIRTAEGKKQRLPGGTVANGVDVVLKAEDRDGWHEVRVEKGSAQVGRGTASLSGSLLLDALSLADLGRVPCNLRLVLDKAQVEYDPFFLKHGRVDGVIVARKFASQTGRALPAWFMEGAVEGDRRDPEAPVLIASVAGDSPSTREPIQLTRAEFGFPMRGSLSAGSPSDEGSARRFYGAAAYYPAPEFDLAMAAGRDVALNTVVLTARAAEDPEAMTLKGTPQAPDLAVRAVVSSGSVRLLQGSLNLREGGLKIRAAPESPIGQVPETRRELAVTSEVWGEAEGTVSGTTLTGEQVGPTEVTLKLSGALPPHHELTASSRPPLTTEQVYELLALAPLRSGREPSGQASLTTDELLAQAVATRVFGEVLAPMEEELSRTLGLEQFEVTFGVNQPVEFRVGKYLVKNLLVSYMYGTGGPEPQFDLRVSYDLRDKYGIGWHTNDRQQSELSLEYRWRF